TGFAGVVGPVEGFEVHRRLVQQLDEHQQGDLVECVGEWCVVPHGQRDVPADPDQPVLLRLVTAGAGGHDQGEAFGGLKFVVMLGQTLRVHLVPSRCDSTASSASSRFSRTSTPMARSRTSASVAVNRAFSPAGSSAASICRSRPASTLTTSAVPATAGASSSSSAPTGSKPRKAWSSKATAARTRSPSLAPSFATASRVSTASPAAA